MSGELAIIEDGGLGALVADAGVGPASFDALQWPDVLQAVRDLLVQQIPVELLDPVAPASERIPRVLEVLRREIGTQVEQRRGPLRAVPMDEPTLLALYRETIGWGPAQAYLDDERIQEVKIIGRKIMVQEEGAGFTLVPEQFATSQEVLARSFLLADRLSVPLDREQPQGTLPLGHGTRMHVTIPPCTPENEALVCIRRGRRTAWALSDVYERKAFSQEVYDLLMLFIRAGCSFIVAGETGSGKTALLEGIVNSWTGTPHVITIEDNTLEINVRHVAWTRELVQTSHEKGAFGRAAKEALRQTPTILAPGETRAEEAGAILTLAVSGHAVITTLHAKTCQAAIQRFADCAAMPGSFVYEGRRDNALEDACDNIEVVIHIEKIAGRRYVREIALLDGTDQTGRAVRPKLVPLMELLVSAEGNVSWRCAASVEGDDLRWKDGQDHTPRNLAQKLRRLRAEGRVRAAPTSQAVVDEALKRAAQASNSGQLDQALTMLRRAWEERRDRRLINAAARALELVPVRMAAAAATSTTVAEGIEAMIRRRFWNEARGQIDQALTDLVTVAALSPAGRWEAMMSMIQTGLKADTELGARVTRARSALAQGTHPREVIELLGEEMDHVSPRAALAATVIRRDAVARLVERGELRPDALDTITERIQTLRREVGDA